MVSHVLFLKAQIAPADFPEGVVPHVLESVGAFMPEFQVAIAAMAILLLDLVIPRGASKHLAWLAILACLYPVVSVLNLHGGHEIFSGMLAVDSYANFFKVFFLLGGIPIILLSYIAKEFENKRMGEYYAILLVSVLGGMLMASSTHMLMAILSLELLSICSYVLVGFHKRQRASSEASLKYIIYGSVAAAVMIYGLSLLYGLAGTGHLPEVGQVVAQLLTNQEALGSERLTVIVALLLTFVGLAYKIAAIPMHFWCPDVYEGAPTPITAFLSVASKAAGFALCLRFFSSMPEVAGDTSWTVVMIVVAIATMTLGNLAALWQKNLKRLFAYSSIAHAGYMMMGLVLLKGEGDYLYNGAQLLTYYLLAYLAMNLGAFAVVILIENRTGSVNVDEYHGLGWKAPFLGLSLAVFLFSLIGIPPTGGFFAKYQLLVGVIERAQSLATNPTLQGFYYVLVGAALLNTAISVYYYLRIVRNMYLVELLEGAEKLKTPFLGNLLVAAMLFLTFYLFLGADTILEQTLNLEILETNGGGH